MARMQRFLSIALLSFGLTGCVAQEKYNALKLDRDRNAEALATAQNQLDAARAEADAYRNQFGSLSGNMTNKDAMIANLNTQLQDVSTQYNDLMRKYEDLAGKQGQQIALPADLSNALSSFAAANPDLVEFDAARGIVKFKSDVTFATGDAELTPKAKEVIARFSAILNSGNAAGYELMIAGHTDNQAVRNPNTIAKGHKNNWYLSAHRAISVSDELIRQNVAPKRLAVVGYAEQRPVAANVNDAGRQQNRRVEVLILPTVIRGESVATENVAAPLAPKKPVMNKDTVEVDGKPALNK